MVVEKRINNNVVLAADEGHQVVLFGNGIGFQSYPGNIVDDSKVEKRFYPAGDMNYTQMAALMSGATPTQLKSVYRIVERAKESFPSMQDSVFFTLLDHLLFALKRHEKNMDITAPLAWEIKKFYPEEYAIGLTFLEIIEKYVGVQLPQSEASFFALHFVNAQLDNITGEEVFELTEMTNSILKMVKYFFQCEFDEESVFYNRFITHVRYYLMRQMKGERTPLADESLFTAVKTACPKEYECANLIAKYLEESRDWYTSDAEKMYLVLHITNLVKKEQTKE